MLLFILWAFLAIGGWLAVAADLKKKGVCWRERHKKGCGGAAAVSVFFVLGWLLWPFGGDDAAAPEKPAEVQEVKWYEGGTLRDAGALEWQQATFENKLATCAKLIAVTNHAGHFNESISSQIYGRESLKPFALELVKQMDIALAPADDAAENERIFANQKVVDVAAMLVVMMGWTSK